MSHSFKLISSSTAVHIGCLKTLYWSPANADKFELMELMTHWSDGSLLNSDDCTEKTKVNFKTGQPTYLSIGEIVIRLEGRIQCRNQVEERLPGDGVAHDTLISGTVPIEIRRQIYQSLWWRKCLQIVRTESVDFSGETLVERLVGSDHLAWITFDSTENSTVPGLERQRIVQCLETRTFQELHD